MVFSPSLIVAKSVNQRSIHTTEISLRTDGNSPTISSRFSFFFEVCPALNLDGLSERLQLTETYDFPSEAVETVAEDMVYHSPGRS